MCEPIRVLHIVGAMYPGGMENFIMNLYRHIDRERFQFDFIVHRKQENDLCDEIAALGGRVYLLPRMTGKPISNLRMIRRIVRENHYPVVIRHTANALAAPQLLAAKCGGAVTVCHSHNETDPQYLLHRMGRILMRHAADVRLACSEKAGVWMYGRQDFRVVHNAIDIRAFAFSAEGRAAVREEFQLEDRHVYGHVANFIASKNHGYLLQIFRVLAEQDPKAVCVCLGDGELRPQIEEEIRRLGLEKRVILTGIRRDVAAWMSAMDVLIFPSKFEGLPLTLIEAQAAGLPALISDTITPDVIVTEGLTERLSIAQDPANWARRAMELAEKRDPERRICQRDRIAAAGYDIEELTRWYEEFLTKPV